MAEHLVGVNGIVQIDPNEVLGIVRDEGVVTGASVLLWPGRWRIALRESGGGGGSGGPVTWADITNKPTSFPPASHRHDASEIDNLPTGSGGPTAWADITGKPSTFPPEVEGTQDIVGAMVVGAGGTYDDAAGTITLPSGGGGGAVSSVAGRTGAVVLSSADLTDSTATGRSLVTAADAAAARTAIGAGTSNLAIGTTGTTAAAGNRQATATAIGMVELATTAEATAGTDTQRAVTPAGLKSVADTKAASTHTHDDRYYTEAESDARYLQTATAQPINAQTGTTYTLVASDAGKLLTLTNAAAITLTVPGSVFTAGQRVDCLVAGAGMVTAVGSSCTVNGTPSLVSRAQWSAFTVLFTSATTAIVIGDLA